MHLLQLHLHPEKLSLPARPQNATSPSQSFAQVLEKTLLAAGNNPPAPARYVVKSGDTLSGIASALKRQAHVPESVPELVDRLAAVNHLDDPDVLRVGQTLDLPPDLVVHARPVNVQNTSPQGAASSVRTYGRAIAATARRLQVDPRLSLAVARAESGVSAATAKEVVLNPRAVSRDGKSVGLFQLTPETGRAQLKELNLRQAYNPLNPQQNIRLGVGYLKYLFKVFSSKETTLQQDLRTTPGEDLHEVRRLAVAAYNAGEGRVARAQAQARNRGKNPARYQDVAPYLPSTTRRYVERVERFAAQMQTEASLSLTK